MNTDHGATCAVCQFFPKPERFMGVVDEKRKGGGGGQRGGNINGKTKTSRPRVLVDEVGSE